MLLNYKNKKTKEEIFDIPLLNEIKSFHADEKSFLVEGDNLLILNYLIKNGYKNKIDLVYIDPPFSTNGNFKIGEDRVSTVSYSKKDPTAYNDVLTGSEFLEFLRERLFLIKELMSNKASIYLHIDYKIGHYVKIIMDEVFGINNFRNDITRIKCNPKNFNRTAYGNIKDLILFYTKTNNPTWNDPKHPFDKNDIEKLFKKTDSKGRKYTTVPLHAPGETNGPTGKKWKNMFPPPGRHWRSNPSKLDELEKEGLIEWSKNGVPRKIIYADENKGKKAQDIWEYKDHPYPKYPTEKNLDLLEFIINASSNKGDLVLDCFCGSGTTMVAAQNLKRNWIGIDSSHHAIKVAKQKLSLSNLTPSNSNNIIINNNHLLKSYKVRQDSLF